jgi:hypothetical protein
LAQVLALDDDAYKNLWMRAGIKGEPDRRPSQDVVLKLYRALNNPLPFELTDRGRVDAAVSVLRNATAFRKGTQPGTYANLQNARLAGRVADIVVQIMAGPNTEDVVVHVEQLLNTSRNSN